MSHYDDEEAEDDYCQTCGNVGWILDEDDDCPVAVACPGCSQAVTPEDLEEMAEEGMWRSLRESNSCFRNESPAA